MTLSEFQASLSQKDPSASLSPALLALWHDGKGDWNRAHKCVTEMNDADSMWVHAYLHRKEGDLSNADYWYSRAGRAPANIPLQVEWASIAQALLTIGAEKKET
jgi:hypothetical protein